MTANDDSIFFELCFLTLHTWTCILACILYAESGTVHSYSTAHEQVYSHTQAALERHIQRNHDCT